MNSYSQLFLNFDEFRLITTSFIYFFKQHVFADMLRSMAVLVAGALAYFFPYLFDPIVVDSVAAIIISLSIFISCIPLLKGLYGTTKEIIVLKNESHVREELQEVKPLVLVV